MTPCPTTGPVEGCCLLAVPNTSSWQVVCSGSVGAPTVIPTLSEWGLVALALALAFVALRRVK